MTISYNLAPIPKWYIADKTGKPLAGGKMFTYRQLDQTQFKFVFLDPAGKNAWTDPIIFDETGSQGPFYWEQDSNNPDELYYIEIFDANDVFQWAIPNFGPAGGGGSVVTSTSNLVNLISNNVMWRSDLNATPVATSTLFKIAPSNNAALANNIANPDGFYTGPDIYFVKNNTASTDFLSMPLFTLGSSPLTGDVTPVRYLKYTCTLGAPGETAKCVQIPIVQDAQNLSGQNVAVTLWARGNSGPGNSLSLRWLQFYGDGASASAPQNPLPFQNIVLTTSWVKYGPFLTTVPSASGKTRGECGNDGLFLQVQYPFDVACDIDFIKPTIFLGNEAPTEDFQTYDQIDAQMDTSRTGDVKMSIANNAPFGWVAMNDGTIGSDTSGATARANIDTFPLYNLIWNSVAFVSNNKWATVIGGLGASAVADFAANKSMTLTKALGRVFAGTLNTEIQATFTYDHTTGIFTVASTTHFPTAVPVILSNSGGALPAGLSSTLTYYVINLSGTTFKLASSPGNAILGTAIALASDNGSGTNTVQVAPYQLGQFSSGGDFYPLQADDLPQHIHAAPSGQNFKISSGGQAFGSGGSNMSDAANTGFNVTQHNPISLIQPTTYMNVFIKL